MSRPLILCAALAGCAAPALDRFDEAEFAATRAQVVDLSAPRTCQARDDTPAVIETVTRSIAEPQSDGTVAYRTERETRIVDDRQEIWFDTLCRDDWTPEFIATLQRALIARELMAGPDTGRMDAATRAAIRAFQAGQGIDSDQLSVAAAKRLGLVAYDRAEVTR